MKLEMERSHLETRRKNAMKSVNNTEVHSSELLFDKLKWLTTKEAAFYLRTTVGAIRTRVCRGTLQAYRHGRELRFLRSDLDRHLKPNF